jgi:adenylyltransferase/sulfurtransferase
MLSSEEIDEYARQIVLQDIGLEGQQKLKDAKVVIIGIGGLGSPTAMMLAAMGIGALRIIDRDIVSKTDLHRQYLYRRKDAGRPKVEVAEERLKEINPRLQVEGIAEPLTSENVDEMVRDVDVIMDGLDVMSVRYIVNRASVKWKKPYIFASAIEMFGNVSTLIPFKTPCLECFYGGLSDDQLPRCAIVGVHPGVLGIVTSIAVSEAIRLIIGKPPKLANRLLFVDLRDLSFDKIELARNPACPVCGESPKGRPITIEVKEVEESCARDGRGTFFVNKSIEGLSLEQVAIKAESYGWKTVGRTPKSVAIRIDENLEVVILQSGTLIAKVKSYLTSIDEFKKRLLDIHKKLTSY